MHGELAGIINQYYIAGTLGEILKVQFDRKYFKNKQRLIPDVI